MLPEGWKKYPVGKLCKSIVPGRNKPKSFSGSIPWVTTPEIKGRYIPSGIQKNFLTEEEIKQCGAKLVPKGGVIIAAVGDLGLTAIAIEPVVLNQQLHAFVCNKKINNEFLAYSLEMQKSFMLSIASKTTIPYLNKANCESIPVNLPPLNEQIKIASILSIWDKAITTTEKLLANSQQQKKALMQQLLTGKKRFPGFDSEWKEYQIFEMGKVVSGGTPDTTNAGYWNGDVCWVTPTDVTALKTRFITNTNRKITMSGVKNSSATLIPAGSLLVCTRATVGLMSISTSEITTNQGFKSLIPNNKFDVNFLYYLFSFNKKEFVRFACGSTFVEISKKDFMKLRFRCPNLEEQAVIASALSSADDEIEKTRIALSNLIFEKRALMQQLLTGKRRVPIY